MRNVEINQRIAYYNSSLFLKKMIAQMTPDVVPYIRNIFESLFYATQSRMIVEDIKQSIVAERLRNNRVVFSHPYNVGTLQMDSRSYAQRHIREWIGYIAKTRDSIFQVLSIIYSIDCDPSSPALSKKVGTYLNDTKDSKLKELYSAYRIETKTIQDLNNFSKHNLNIWGVEKLTPYILNDVDYHIRLGNSEYSTNKLISSDKEKTITDTIVRLLDYVFAKSNITQQEKRFYAISSFDTALVETMEFVNATSFPERKKLAIEFQIQTRADGTCFVASASLTVDSNPDKEIFVAEIITKNTAIDTMQQVTVFRCNAFDVYRAGACIGIYRCRDPKDQHDDYFHFKKYEFLPNEKHTGKYI